MTKKILLFFLFSFRLYCYPQDSFFIKVHFLYGSKPCPAFKHTEPKWFGGMLGGHAGIEGDSNRILSFVPQGKFHVFAKNNDTHSMYAEHSVNNFYGILGGNPDSVKKAVVIIPVTGMQKQLFDSIATAYVKKPPYDYAFFGMRCGAATYEILAQLGILPQYTYSETYRKIFYPRRLRKRLFKKAKQNGWTIQTQQGSCKRKWEHD